MYIPASNRQKKLLRFFKVPFASNISAGAAGWEIADLMSSEECRDQWRQYLYLTGDFDSDTDELKEFDESDLESVEVPEDWSSANSIQKYREDTVAEILHDNSPFDRPEPAVIFKGRTFMFTGRFDFGTRKACQSAVTKKGGIAPKQKTVSRLIDYLVIGSGGNVAWKKGAYGNKIEAAILARREYGTPAIISERHWSGALYGT